jgi:small conductance mechanosensitive channel
VGSVAGEIQKGITEAVQQFAKGFGGHIPLLVAAVAVLAVAWIVSRVSFSATRSLLARTSTTGHVDILVARFVRGSVMAVGIVAALGVAGVNAGALVASLGLVGLTVSLALKDVLANYVSGVMLLLQGPFKVGDTIVVDGMEGTVADVTARTTTLNAGDGREIHIPNSTIFSAVVTNVSRNPVRRFEITLTVPVDVDLAAARGVVLAAISDTGGVLHDPGPDAQVGHIGAGSARIIAHGWVDASRSSSGEAQAAALVIAAKRLHDAGLAHTRTPRR